MGARGPSPKSAARKQGHRAKAEADERQELGNLVGLPAPIVAEPPKAKSIWLKRTRDEWKVFWGEPQSKLVQRTHWPALYRMFSLRDEWDRLDQVIRAQREEEILRDGEYVTVKVSNYMVTGSQGQLVLNPLLRRKGDVEKELRVLEDRFGGTPAALLRMGIDFGAATSSLEQMNKDLVAKVEIVDPR